MCDAMFIYAIERAEANGNLPVIPEWEHTVATDKRFTNYTSDAGAFEIIEREGGARLQEAA